MRARKGEIFEIPSHCIGRGFERGLLNWVYTLFLGKSNAYGATDKTPFLSIRGAIAEEAMDYVLELSDEKRQLVWPINKFGLCVDIPPNFEVKSTGTGSPYLRHRDIAPRPDGSRGPYADRYFAWIGFVDRDNLFSRTFAYLGGCWGEEGLRHRLDDFGHKDREPVHRIDFQALEEVPPPESYSGAVFERPCSPLLSPHYQVDTSASDELIEELWKLSFIRGQGIRVPHTLTRLDDSGWSKGAGATCRLALRLLEGRGTSSIKSWLEDMETLNEAIRCQMEVVKAQIRSQDHGHLQVRT